MIGRIVRPADFERVLAAPQRSRSTHFAVHHLASGPLRPASPAGAVVETGLVPVLSPELSTGGIPQEGVAVDGERHWLGLVVPKRLARRAVTRNLIKRQVREAMRLHAPALPAGLWVVRLRAPFDRAVFLSPASRQLSETACAELGTLFDRAIHRPLPATAGGRRSTVGGPKNAGKSSAGKAGVASQANAAPASGNLA